MTVGKKKGKGGGGKAKDAQKERVAEVSKSKPRLPCRFFRNGLCKNVRIYFFFCGLLQWVVQCVALVR